MLKNLWLETVFELEDNGKTFDDVLWIGCRDFKISKEDFKLLANVEYDSGYGAPEVAQDLLIVGDGWWMERGEYDGAEWWEWKEPPKEPEKTRVVSNLVCGDLAVGWSSLKDLNSPTVEENPLPY